MANEYKQMLKRASKKDGGQESVRPTSAVAAVAFPKGRKNDGLSDYINAIYSASENARTAQLEAAYNQAASDLASARAKAGARYAEAQRQTEGEAARQQAAFRETANAYGLNSGAGGQAALAMGNQMQNDMSSLGRMRAQDMSELDRQRMLLAQNFQQQRQQLMAENDYNRNMTLYGEAVRTDDANRQEAQFDKQMNMQKLQMAMANAKANANVSNKNAQQDTEPGDVGGTPDWVFNAYMNAMETYLQIGNDDRATEIMNAMKANYGLTAQQDAMVGNLMAMYGGE